VQTTTLCPISRGARWWFTVRSMKVGIMFANSVFPDAEAAQFARAAEAAGFESLWTVEHVVFPANYGSTYPYDASGKMPAHPGSKLPDPLIWLAWVGAATSTIKLATGIVILPQRNPVILAKQLATLDYMSGGRVEFGIGVGWLREEFDALGVPWERRGERADEYVAAMRTLWSGELCSFEGEFTSFSDVASNPKPINGTIPIVVGGHSPAAARRAGRLGDGFFPGKGNIAELTDIVRQSAADAGRDPEAIEVTFGHPGVLGDDPAAAFEELADAGVSRTIVPSLVFHGNFAETLPEWGAKLGLG